MALFQWVKKFRSPSVKYRSEFWSIILDLITCDTAVDLMHLEDGLGHVFTFWSAQEPVRLVHITTESVSFNNRERQWGRDMNVFVPSNVTNTICLCTCSEKLKSLLKKKKKISSWTGILESNKVWTAWVSKWIFIWENCSFNHKLMNKILNQLHYINLCFRLWCTSLQYKPLNQITLKHMLGGDDRQKLRNHGIVAIIEKSGQNYISFAQQYSLM